MTPNPHVDFTLSSAEAIERLSDLSLPPDAAASWATLAFEGGADAALLAAIDRSRRGPSESSQARAELLASARERAMETLDGARLCACLLLVNWDSGEDFTRLPERLAKALRAQGFSPDARLLSVPEAQALSAQGVQKIHANALGGREAQWPPQGAPARGGLQLRALLASLPGPDRGAWDRLDEERQALALASLMDIAAKGWPEGSVAALAAAPLGAALRQADAVGCPIALRALVESACSRALCKPRDLAAACSLHDQGSAEETPFWRLSVRVKDTGFVLCGMDWPLSGMSAEGAFYNGVILELASLGVDECYHIDGAYDQLLCPDCDEPLYPAPDLPAWREAALEEGLNPSGQHDHQP